MKYKTQVSDKLDSIEQKLNILIRGLEERRFSPQEILNKIQDTKKVTEQVIELVDKEKEEI
jgi:vacuolar-type H+-ATPase subunit I/STV1